MSGRQWLVNLGRLALLRWRLVRGTALPQCAMAVLAALDRLAARLELRARERALGRAFDAEASRKVDKALAELEGRR